MLVLYLAALENEADRQKFQKLYEAYEKKVYAVALKILENHAMAEDAAQQTWLRLLKNWERVSALSWAEVGGYTVTAAKNAAVDMVRSQSRTAFFPENWEPPAPESNESEYNYIVQLVCALPENYRRILELKLVEERSNKEIAHAMGLNESTVASRILRGKTMLRQQLEKEGYTYA